MPKIEVATKRLNELQVKTTCMKHLLELIEDCDRNIDYHAEQFSKPTGVTQEHHNFEVQAYQQLKDLLIGLAEQM